MALALDLHFDSPEIPPRLRIASVLFEVRVERLKLAGRWSADA
jgi:hypothetical protein